jgi:hypothetical protein
MAPLPAKAYRLIIPHKSLFPFMRRFSKICAFLFSGGKFIAFICFILASPNALDESMRQEKGSLCEKGKYGLG